MRFFGYLKQVSAVEGCSRMRGDIDRADDRAARRIEGVQLTARGKPDALAVIRDAVHVVDTGKRSVLTNDLRRPIDACLDPESNGSGAGSNKVVVNPGTGGVIDRRARPRYRTTALCPYLPRATRAPAAPCVGWRQARVRVPSSTTTRRRQKRKHGRMVSVDGPRQYDDLSRTARRERKSPPGGTDRGHCPKHRAKPRDFNP